MFWKWRVQFNFFLIFIENVLHVKQSALRDYSTFRGLDNDLGSTCRSNVCEQSFESKLDFSGWRCYVDGHPF